MMQPVMDTPDVVAFETSLGEKGLKTVELMRRAGAIVALQAAKAVHEGSVVILCGMGNNGGDGWVAADNLARHGYEINVVSAATPAVLKSQAARRAAQRASEMGIPIHVDPTFDELTKLLGQADVVIDAVFGIGFKGVMPAPYDMWVQAVETAFNGTLISVDVPSGINASTGAAEGVHFTADTTVTMFAIKPGLISGEGRAASGSIVVATLLSDAEGLSDIFEAATAYALGPADYYDVLPPTDPNADKYSRGRVLVVAGSARYPGAAVLSALAAARAGAGYVTLAVPEPVVPTVQAHLLSVPVVGLAADADGSFAAEAADQIQALAAKADAVVAGPGMTTSFGACEVVRALLGVACALVLDADALNALVKICTGSAEAHPDALRRDYPLVLTPHVRELARLGGRPDTAYDSLAAALHAAQALVWAVGSSDLCVIAKGPVTAVVTVEGTLIPEPGPAALATAGTGDVLSGIVGSILARSCTEYTEDDEPDPSEILLRMAAADRIHALAGFLAAEEHGSCGVIAPDVAEKVGVAQDTLIGMAAQEAEKLERDPGSRLQEDLSFEDESRITPPPEVERLIRADAEAARAADLPGEVDVSGIEVEEPQSAPPEVEITPLEKMARPDGSDDLDEPAPAAASEEPSALSASKTTVMPAVEAGDTTDETIVFTEVEIPVETEAEAATPEKAEEEASAPEADDAESSNTNLPPFLSRQSTEGQDEPAGSEIATEPPDPADLARQRREAFHERATLHIDDDSVTPVDERPSAKPRRHR